MNYIGVFGMNISTIGALGGVVPHVNFQVSHEEIKEQIYAYIFGQ